MKTKVLFSDIKMNSIDCIGGYCRARREGFKSIYFLLLCIFFCSIACGLIYFASQFCL